MSDPYKVYVANWPTDMYEKDTEEYFTKNFGTVLNIKLLRDKEGQPNGKVFVTFENEEDGKDCIRELNGANFEKKVLIVKEATNQGNNYQNNGNRQKMQAGKKDQKVYSLKINPKITKTTEIKQYEKLLENFKTTIMKLSGTIQAPKEE